MKWYNDMLPIVAVGLRFYVQMFYVNNIIILARIALRL